LVSSIINLVEIINPNIKIKNKSTEINSTTQILNETLDYINNINKQNNIKCECESEKLNYFSIQYHIKCLNLFQELFDVKCFHNIDSKISEIYYKYGQINNFKKSLINILNLGIYFRFFLDFF
jgi:hypothetical protein